MKRWISIIAILVVIALIGFKLASNKKEINSRKEVKTETSRVMVTIAEITKQIPSITLAQIGTAQAYQDVMVSSETSGVITQINFKLGDYVQKGKVLAKVDDKYKTLALETAKINFEKAKDDYERYQKMRAGDAVSETQLRDMRIAYENSKVQLDQSIRQLSDTRITAPFGGYITSKNVDLGAYVNISTPIAGIADISQLKVVISVSESDVYLIETGQEVNITAKVYPDAVYKGKVSHISPKGDDSHTYPVEIIIPNNSKYPLKAGTYINTQIDRGNVNPILAVPREAIISSIKDPSVYVLQPDSTVKLTRIMTDKDFGIYIGVLSGLEEGDKVITNGQINLMDGSRVQIAQNTK